MHTIWICWLNKWTKIILTHGCQTPPTVHTVDRRDSTPISPMIETLISEKNEHVTATVFFSLLFFFFSLEFFVFLLFVSMNDEHFGCSSISWLGFLIDSNWKKKKSVNFLCFEKYLSQWESIANQAVARAEVFTECSFSQLKFFPKSIEQVNWVPLKSQNEHTKVNCCKDYTYWADEKKVYFFSLH